jgi:hypothetical protein
MQHERIVNNFETLIFKNLYSTWNKLWLKIDVETDKPVLQPTAIVTYLSTQAGFVFHCLVVVG